MRENKNFDEPARIIKRADAPEITVYGLTLREAVTNYFTSRFSAANFRRIVRDSFPQKEDSTGEKIRKIIMDVSFVLLMLALSYMVFYYASYRERINEFGDWQETIDSIDEDNLFDFEKKMLWENIKEKYPDVDFPEGMMLKFADLYAVNQDAVGALRIPEMDFFCPLLLNRSTPNYYLWKNLYGQYSRYGNPYIDYRCSIEKGSLSKNTIIYGHNTHDKLGFNKLTEYMKLEGYRKAPVITVETLYEKTQWKIFAVMLTNSTAAADRGHLFTYLITDFSSSSQFTGLISGIRERSMINTGVDVNADDKILTLYTCYQHIFDGGRLVVFARLVRDGESAQVDVSEASFNYSARYPQAYYDQLGLTNPYEKLTEPLMSEADESSSLSEEESSSDMTATDIPAVEEPGTDEVFSGNAEITTEASASEEKTTKKPSEEKTTKKPSEEKTTKKPSEEKTTKPAKPAEQTTLVPVA
ncbi:MAG: sortase [Clostridia bacterium]|nr:sortase [Clostridia bacterium]